MSSSKETTKPLRKLFRIYIPIFISIALVFILFLIDQFVFDLAGDEKVRGLLNKIIWSDLLVYILVGFLSQMIDGALGMAYGLSSTSFLISTGVSPVIASASTHISEVFTTGISGWSHLAFGNVKRRMFKKLLIYGTIGAGLGAYFLTSIDGNIIKPYVSVYLLVMGVLIIVKAFRKVVLFKEYKKIGPLAFFGGFLDASGGGGWGPVVTSTLIHSGGNPRHVIGTVNAVEFFVAIISSSVFIILVGVQSFHVITGLILGGILAAPLGAFVAQKLNLRVAMITVGSLIVLLSVRTILIVLGIL